MRVPRALVLLLLAACAGPQWEPESYSRTAAATADPEKKKSIWDDFIDDEDRALDVSDFLERDIGFLPLVMPITEPAVGFGLIGGLVFFHDKGEQKPGVQPTLTAVVGGATENDTWLGAVMHQHVWREGKIRYLGGAGYASVNLEFFGIGSGPDNDRRTDLNFEGLFILQEGEHRLGQSNWFLGGDWIFADLTTTLDPPFGILPPFRLKARTSGIGAFSSYDSRNNHFTPSKGVDFELGARWYGEAIGSDSEFWKARAKFRTWLEFGEFTVLGLRLDGEWVDGAAPLYELAWIQLRGVQAFRYVDDVAVTFEVEPRFQITDRWGAVVFAGIGKTAGNLTDLGAESTVWSAGAGFRYMLARKRGIQAGIDVAYSDDDVAFYITVGSAWMR